MKFLALVLSAAALSGQTLILDHVTVIDATGAKPRVNVSVQLDGDRIRKIGKKLQAPAGVQRIDAKGKFVIPGLWDMHMHLGFPQQYASLLVANGVTGIREMYTGLPLRTLLELRTRADTPRIAISGFVDGPLMITPGQDLPEGAIPIANEQQAR